MYKRQLIFLDEFPVSSGIEEKNIEVIDEEIFKPENFERKINNRVVKIKFGSKGLFKSFVFPLDEESFKLYYRTQKRGVNFSFSLNLKGKEILVKNKDGIKWRGEFPKNFYASFYGDIDEVYADSFKMNFIGEYPDFLIFTKNQEGNRVEFVYFHCKKNFWGVKFLKEVIPQVECLKLKKKFPVDIDGWLNDEVWKEARHLIDFQRDTEKLDITDVYYFFKGGFLFIFVEGNFIDGEILIEKDNERIYFKRNLYSYISKKEGEVWIKDPYPKAVFSFSEQGCEIMIPEDMIREGSYKIMTASEEKIFDKIFPVIFKGE